MVNKLTKSALSTLIFELNNLEEVQKFKRLENLVKKDKTLANKVLELHKVSKQMTNAKEFGLVNAYDQYHDLYQNLLMDIEDNVILQLYLESSEEVKNILTLVMETIEFEIKQKINE